MKIGTWNLRFLFNNGTRLYSGIETEFTKEFVEKRFKYFAEQFDLLDCDILFLQEVGDETALQKIVSQTKNNYSYFVAKPDKYGTGNAVIYKSSLKCKCESFSTNTILPVFDEGDVDVMSNRIYSRRDYVKLETKINTDTIVMLGLHIKARFLIYKNGNSFPNEAEQDSQVLAADGVIRSEIFRLNQAKKVREIASSILSKENTHLIILGDFNAEQNSEILKIILGKIKNRKDSLEIITVDSRIDHILISDFLKGKMSEVNIVTKLKGSGDRDSVESDHAPVTARLQF